VNAPPQMLRRCGWSDFVETLDLWSELSMTFQGRGDTPPASDE